MKKVINNNDITNLIIIKTRFINKFCEEISSESNPITAKGAKTIIENYYLIEYCLLNHLQDEYQQE